MTHYDRATQLVGEFIDEGRFLLIEVCAVMRGLQYP